MEINYNTVFFMTSIAFEDNGVLDSMLKQSIKISFQRDQNFESKAAQVEESVAFDIIDTLVKKINEHNKDIIADYHYEIVNDTEFNIFVLFKHIFKKFDEPQRYCYLKFFVLKDKQKLLFHNNMLTDVKQKFPIKLPMNCVAMPLVNGSISFTEKIADNSIDVHVNFKQSADKISPNKSMIENFICNSFLNSVDVLKKCLRFQGNKLSFSPP